MLIYIYIYIFVSLYPMHIKSHKRSIPSIVYCFLIMTVLSAPAVDSDS